MKSLRILVLILALGAFSSCRSQPMRNRRLTPTTSSNRARSRRASVVQRRKAIIARRLRLARPTRNRLVHVRTKRSTACVHNVHRQGVLIFIEKTENCNVKY